MKDKIEIDELVKLTISIVQLITAMVTLQTVRENKKNSSKKTSSSSKKKK